MQTPSLSLYFLSYAQSAASHDNRLLSPSPSPISSNGIEAGKCEALVFHYDLHVFDGSPLRTRQQPHQSHRRLQHLQPDRTEHRPVGAKKPPRATRMPRICRTDRPPTKPASGLWQSDVNPYCLGGREKVRDGKGDIVRMTSSTPAAEYGIQPGIYIGIRWNSLLGYP